MNKNIFLLISCLFLSKSDARPLKSVAKKTESASKPADKVPQKPSGSTSSKSNYKQVSNTMRRVSNLRSAPSAKSETSSFSSKTASSNELIGSNKTLVKSLNRPTLVGVASPEMRASSAPERIKTESAETKPETMEWSRPSASVESSTSSSGNQTESSNIDKVKAGAMAAYAYSQTDSGKNNIAKAKDYATKGWNWLNSSSSNNSSTSTSSVSSETNPNKPLTESSHSSTMPYSKPSSSVPKFEDIYNANAKKPSSHLSTMPWNKQLPNMQWSRPSTAVPSNVVPSSNATNAPNFEDVYDVDARKAAFRKKQEELKKAESNKSSFSNTVSTISSGFDKFTHSPSKPLAIEDKPLANSGSKPLAIEDKVKSLPAKESNDESWVGRATNAAENVASWFGW